MADVSFGINRAHEGTKSGRKESRIVSSRESRSFRTMMAWIVLCPLFASILTASFVALVWNVDSLRDVLVAMEPNIVAALVSAAIMSAVVLRLAAWRGKDLPWNLNSVGAKSTFWLTVALAGGCMALFTLPHFFVWTQVPANYSAFGGLFPYSDAKLYYDGALHVISEGDLDTWNMRRPINALLFSLRLTMAGQNLQVALLMQGGILGAACFFLGRTVSKDLGVPAGLFVVACLYGFSREYVSSTLSETLGVTLGTIATALLWRAARDRIEWMVVLGILIMTLGLNARAGAFFALPLLVMWVGFAFRGDRIFAWRVAGLGSAAVVLGFVINSSVLWVYGNGMGIGHGNFAHTLYGLSSGTPDWTKIYADFPEARFLEEKSQNDFIYARAWDNISNRPSYLYKGLEDGAKIFSSKLAMYTNQVIALPVEKIDNQIHQLMAIVGLIFLWRHRREPVVSIIFAANIGMLLSGPIVFPDGGRRVLAVSYPFYFIFFALCLAKPRPFQISLSSEAAESTDSSTFPGTRSAWELGPVALAVAFLIAIFCGPVVAQWVDASRVRHTADAEYDNNHLVTRVGPQSPHIKILQPGAQQKSFIPEVRYEDFVRHLETSPLCIEFSKALLQHIHGDQVVMVPYNVSTRGKAVLVVGSSEMIPKTWRDIELTGEVHEAETFDLFFVDEVRYLSGNDAKTTAMTSR